METPVFNEVDYLSIARERYPFYLKDKDVFDRYVQLLLSLAPEISATLKQLKEDRWLDTAKGVNLDIIGDLVGQKRLTIPNLAIAGFGFKGASGALGFGTLADVSVGGLFNSISNDSSGQYIDDDLYRLFIKSKILYNSTRCTREELISALQLLLGDGVSHIIEQANARITIMIGKELTPLEKYVIKGVKTGRSLVPVPIGVAVDYVQFKPKKAFGFLGHPDAQGFGTITEIVETEGGYGMDYGNSYGKKESSSTIPEAGGYFSTLF
jgi:hypothetical protein